MKKKSLLDKFDDRFHIFIIALFIIVLTASIYLLIKQP